MEKVYLAKSNKANPDDVSRVRQFLSTFDFEIIEYKGGSYSHKSMLECGLLVIVPDLTNDYEWQEDDTVTIGKGLFEQIESFSIINGDNNIIIIINTESGIKYTFLNEDEEIYEIPNGDYIEYAYLPLGLTEAERSLHNYIIKNYDVDIVKSVSINSNEYYVLIKN